MKENIKARFKAKRFNIWTEKIDLKNREGYFIYNGQVYFGNRFGVFFKSCQILLLDYLTTEELRIFLMKHTEVTNEQRETNGSTRLEIRLYGINSRRVKTKRC